MNGQNPPNIGVKKKRWVVCFENTILDLDLSIYEKMVYIVLCSHAKKDGPCFPSVNRIAEEASCSRTKVFEALNTLEKLGVIARDNRIFEGRGQTSNLYEIIDIIPRTPDGRGDSRGVPPRSATRTGACANRTWGVRDADAPLDVLEQDHLNRVKEHTPPAPPRGEGERESFGSTTQNPEPQPGKPIKTLKAGEPRPESPDASRQSLPDHRDYQTIADAYNSALPELPKSGKITASNVKTLKSRIREDPARLDIEWWRRFFLSVREFPWPMGHNSKGWKADFDWLIGESGMRKILGGRFQRSYGDCCSSDASYARQAKYTDEEGEVDLGAILRDMQANEFY
jgi:predicted transcriptional regulator